MGRIQIPPIIMMTIGSMSLLLLYAARVKSDPSIILIISNPLIPVYRCLTTTPHLLLSTFTLLYFPETIHRTVTEPMPLNIETSMVAGFVFLLLGEIQITILLPFRPVRCHLRG